MVNYIIGRSPRIFLEVLAVTAVVGVFLFFISSGKTLEDIIPIITLIVLIIVRSIPGFVNINTSLNALNFEYVSLKEILNIFLEDKNITANKDKKILKIINLNSIELKKIFTIHMKKEI